MCNIQEPGLEECFGLEDAGQRMKWRNESKGSTVFVTDSSDREERESGCARVVRILEARKERQMEWRLQ